MRLSFQAKRCLIAICAYIVAFLVDIVAMRSNYVWQLACLTLLPVAIDLPLPHY